LLMASYFEHDARILDAAARALEDANFHVQAGVVDDLYVQLVKVDDDELIDDDRRKALLARLSEVYGKQIISESARSHRLSILTALADRPITSISRRWGNMTVGDFNRVMKVLDTFSK